MDIISLFESLMLIGFGIHTLKYRDGKLTLSERKEKLREKRLKSKHGPMILNILTIVLISGGILIFILTIVEYLYSL